MDADHNIIDIQHLQDRAENPRHHSVSKQMYERFARRKIWQRFIAFIYVVSLTAYLSWRFTIINDDSLMLSSVYFAAECIGFILGLMSIITSWNYNHHDPKQAPQGLSVDVLIPTYKEPLEIIRRTVMAAKEIEYPHGTYVLDDGKRPEVKKMAEDLGVQYLSRTNNTDAKAGNLNFGLEHSKADYVMVFDADHIAMPHALNAMLGFFEDDNVAMVQTPQDYYNIDAFQYMNAKKTGGLWHDQSFFYNISQPCRDSVNASSCVGTGVVYRRSVLNEIGGIPADTVTEDIHTSLKVHKAGYRTINLNESVAYGVAASDLEEYYITRHRWASGNLHSLQKENILFCKGLSFKQRLSYLSLGLIYLEGWQQLMLFAIPMIALVFGIPPFEITIFNIAVVLTFPFISYFLLQEIGCGFTRYWANELFAMARWPIHVMASAGLFGKKISWRSSTKNIKGRINWRLMAPQLSVMVLSLLAVAIALVRLSGDYEVGPLFELIYAVITFSEWPDFDMFARMPDGYTLDLVAIAGAWALYSALRAGLFARKAIRDAKNSHIFFRFPVPLPVSLSGDQNNYGRVVKISEDWIRFADFNPQRAQVALGDVIPVTVHMPAGAQSFNIMVSDISLKSKGSSRVIEGRIMWSSVAERDQLARGLYSVDWHREFLNRNEYFLTPSDLFLKLIPFRKKAATIKTWNSCLYESENSDRCGIIGLNGSLSGKNQQATLLCFEYLPAHTKLQTRMFTENNSVDLELAIILEQPISSLVEKGLDRMRVHRYLVQVSVKEKLAGLSASDHVANHHVA